MNQNVQSEIGTQVIGRISPVRLLGGTDVEITNTFMVRTVLSEINFYQGAGKPPHPPDEQIGHYTVCAFTSYRVGSYAVYRSYHAP